MLPGFQGGQNPAWKGQNPAWKGTKPRMEGDKIPHGKSLNFYDYSIRVITLFVGFNKFLRDIVIQEFLYLFRGALLLLLCCDVAVFIDRFVEHFPG